jgi:hypothetical protein
VGSSPTMGVCFCLLHSFTRFHTVSHGFTRHDSHHAVCRFGSFRMPQHDLHPIPNCPCTFNRKRITSTAISTTLQVLVYSYCVLDWVRSFEFGVWRLKVGVWRLKVGGWSSEGGGWRLEVGARRLECLELGGLT